MRSQFLSQLWTICEAGDVVRKFGGNNVIDELRTNICRVMGVWDFCEIKSNQVEYLEIGIAKEERTGEQEVGV